MKIEVPEGWTAADVQKFLKYLASPKLQNPAEPKESRHCRTCGHWSGHHCMVYSSECATAGLNKKTRTRWTPKQIQ